jgi:thiosulfate/3-mercaptopyruvate sulfurtransferase
METTRVKNLVSVVELRQMQASGVDLRLLDCRFNLFAPDEGDRAFVDGHIPGALRADLDRHLCGPRRASAGGRHPLPTPEAWAATVQDWAITPDTRVVAYDDSGGCFAARAWWLLRYFGHRHAAVLDGGWSAWCALAGEAATPSGTQSFPAEAPLPTATPVPHAAPSMVVTMEELRAFKLIDARDPERYAGVHEPIDQRAGHIPGASNRFWKVNLDADGFFLPPEVLRRQWLELLDGSSPHEVACYCGSGVTACHNLLALELAALAGARLYPGSWSEYCEDPLNPAAIGDAPGTQEQLPPPVD